MTDAKLKLIGRIHLITCNYFLCYCSYQRNKQNFLYRNGWAMEISKKIKDRKNKK